MSNPIAPDDTRPGIEYKTHKIRIVNSAASLTEPGDLYWKSGSPIMLCPVCRSRIAIGVRIEHGKGGALSFGAIRCPAWCGAYFTVSGNVIEVSA